MSVSTAEKKKFRVVPVMKDAGYVDKLYYFTVLYYCGSSHWRCSGLNFLTLTFLNFSTFFYFISSFSFLTHDKLLKSW